MVSLHTDSFERINALIIEDNPGDVDLLREIADGVIDIFLHQEMTLEDGCTAYLKNPYDLILLDLSLPDSEGIDTIRRITTEFPDAPVVVMTGIDDEALACEAVGSGVEDYLSKSGLTAERFRRTVLYALERHRAKQAFWSERKNFVSVVDYHPDANILVDNGVICYANQASAKLFGRSLESLCGMPFCPPSGESTNEVDILRPDGTPIVAEARTIDVKLDERAAHLVVLRDISPQRHAQLVIRELERSHSLYQSVEYLLHELNNPLSALLSHLNLAHKKFSDVQKNMNEKAADGQGGTPSECLEISRQVEKSLGHAEQAGKRLRESILTLRCAGHTVQSEMPTSTYLASEIGLAISIVERNCIPNMLIERQYGHLPKVSAQPLRLAEVFSALIRNAVESATSHTKAPRVRVSAIVVNNRVHIHVEDNGKGIPKNIEKEIFMPFYSTKRHESAVGLGLTMARDIVKDIGGDIYVDESSLGGAKLTVALPVSITARSSLTPPSNRTSYYSKNGKYR